MKRMRWTRARVVALTLLSLSLFMYVWSEVEVARGRRIYEQCMRTNVWAPEFACMRFDGMVPGSAAVLLLTLAVMVFGWETWSLHRRARALNRRGS